MAEQAANKIPSDCVVCMGSRPLLRVGSSSVNSICVLDLMKNYMKNECKIWDTAHPVTPAQKNKPVFNRAMARQNFTCIFLKGNDAPIGNISDGQCAETLQAPFFQPVSRADVWWWCGGDRIFDSTGKCALVTLLFPISVVPVTLDDLAVAPEHFKDALGLLHCSRRSKPTWLGADEPTYIDAIGVPRGVLDEYKLADQIFKQQKIKKPLGPDLVSPSCLKVCGDQLVPVFTKIFNRSLELSEVPTCFKLTTIIPIPKKAAVSGLNDYRPVALTFVVIKSFERLVLDHLKSVMVPQLDPLEFAFQANRFVLHP
ncbi:uncharacterized protein LOC133500553 isoform X1 [Syngnathoides biaculeatus]|uniref:uncharacterized protein LOC133500553 isoform X1 n=1 Tax=Syngnathoides biaculeatus TaxID=300417 RepID=UPI002ADE7F8C|nr:uncharacterized protein LOC133500553 isoform X1 [Syngnathoides biaculeatus]XP_061675352.1 uncharacterized protein LOC133500553 isoform X1 [Syngnathoides biaculeatus]